MEATNTKTTFMLKSIIMQPIPEPDGLPAGGGYKVVLPSGQRGRVYSYQPTFNGKVMVYLETESGLLIQDPQTCRPKHELHARDLFQITGFFE